MKLKIQSSFERDARKSPKYIVSQLDALFTLIIATQKLTDISNLKKLSGYKNDFRIRVYDYRIEFLFEEKIIILVRLFSRKDIYKHFP